MILRRLALQTLLLIAPASAWGEPHLFPAPSGAIGEELVIYSSLDLPLAEPLIAGFQQRAEDVSVRYELLLTGEITERILRESDQGERTADFAFSSAMDQQVKLSNGGYAQPVVVSETADWPRWANWRDTAYALTFEPAVLAYYRPAFIDRPPPATRYELLAWLREQAALGLREPAAARIPALPVGEAGPDADGQSRPDVSGGMGDVNGQVERAGRGGSDAAEDTGRANVPSELAAESVSEQAPLAIGTYDIERSAVGYLFLARDQEHFPAIWTLVSAMGKAGLARHSTTQAVLEDVSEGRVLIGYNLLGSYAADWARSHPEVGLLLPRDFVVVVSRVGLVPRAAARADLGADFLGYLMSAEGQTVLAQQLRLPAVSLEVSDEASARAMQEALGEQLRPVPVSPALLVYLDQSKRQRLLARWRAALAAD